MTKKFYFLLPAFLLVYLSAYSQVSPIVEGFNSVSSLPAAGWSFINRSSPSNTVSDWQQGDASLFTAQSGAPNSYIQSYGLIYNSVLVISNWLLSPQRTLHNGDVITFYTRTQALSPEGLEVRLTTNGNSSNVGSSASSIGDFTTLLLTVNPNKIAGGYPAQWTKYSITLSGLSGTPQGRIAFRHVNGTYPGSFCTAAASIDNFTYTAYLVATRLYVDSSATESGSGVAWGSPFKTLNEAMDIAGTYNNVAEIWVKKGTYYPDEGPGRTNNDRSLSFSLKNGLAIYGGFAGGETSLNQRNLQTNATILSGDIDQVAGNEGNAYHVIQNNGLNNTAVMDGFTVTVGNANGSSNDDSGGGMYNNNSSPSLVNCSFLQNTAFYGGGMFDRSLSSPSLVNCSFSKNSASVGGGMYNTSSSPSLVNCNFSQNTASGSGGGMYNSSSASIVNCSFSQNTAIFFGSGMANFSSSTSLSNCILWGNTSSGDQIYGNQSIVSYSIVQGGYAGTGNSAADPLFINPANPAGPDGFFGTADDGLLLQAGSPAINKGNNAAVAGINTDITGAARIQNGIVDMGAYESPYTILPAIFTSVKAYQKNTGVAVSWQVATESNLHHYEVEKSADGTRFVPAATQTPRAGNVSPFSYIWFDSNPFNGTNFYRIKAVDNDGTVKYTGIVKVFMGDDKSGIVVYPNPVKNKIVMLQFKNQPEGKYTLQLFNTTGQLVYSKTVMHNGGTASETLQFSEKLSAGIYRLSIGSSGKQAIQQQVIVE